MRDDLVAVEADGERVVYDPAADRLHHLNPTASLVFRLADGTGTVSELVGDLAEAFGEPVRRVDRDVRALLRAFRETGLLAGTRPPEEGRSMEPPEGEDDLSERIEEQVPKST